MMDGMESDPASPRQTAERYLRRVGSLPDAAIDLAETALFLAAMERPQSAIEPYREHLQAMARDLSLLLDGPQPRAVGTEGRIRALRAVMVEMHGYRGDAESYDALDNADLMRVIDRRKGLPVALAILWLHVARTQGWSAAGLNFPGHFLIRIEGGDRPVILDPFHGGRAPSIPELRDLARRVAGDEAELSPENYAPIGNRAVLIRLQNNIKLRLLRAKDTARAIAVLERMALIAPEEPALWREAGLLQAELGNLRAGLGCLEQALLRVDHPQARDQIAAEIKTLRQRLN